MKVLIVKFNVKTRKPYFVPARYSSHTYARVFVDGENKGEWHVGQFGGFKKFIELAKKKYGFEEFNKELGGSEYRD